MRRRGPKRMNRVDSFSFYIPQILGDEYARFLEEARNASTSRAGAAKVGAAGLCTMQCKEASFREG